MFNQFRNDEVLLEACSNKGIEVKNPIRDKLLMQFQNPHNHYQRDYQFYQLSWQWQPLIKWIPQKSEIIKYSNKFMENSNIQINF
jgi:hypothetical protein